MLKRITIAYGDGIGPEIMSVVLDILKKAGAEFTPEVVEMGEKVYQKGFMSGIRPDDWWRLRRNSIFLKAPISTPQGGGFKSLNVRVRKSLGLYANVRPVRSLSPYVPSLFPDMDVVILRENEEDLYAGIEHRQTDEVFQCLKLISLSGCERIIGYAFEYARDNRRKKITCMTKDNIMKLTDGTFRSIFEETSKQYSEIETEHWIIDIGAAKFATNPSAFDVVVLPNLYGDILSDISAQLAGSVGIGGSANIGRSHAMFEAVHGSAPRRAGQDCANPSGLLNAALLMLDHIGESLLAKKIHNAWLTTIEDGIHTYDIYKKGLSKQKVGTKDFGRAVVERLGAQPKELAPSSFSAHDEDEDNDYPVFVPNPLYSVKKDKVLDGIDIFICEENRDPSALAKRLRIICDKSHLLDLMYITNRGVQVWPIAFPETICVDHWRCRFLNGTIPEVRQLKKLTEESLASLDRELDKIWKGKKRPGQQYLKPMSKLEQGEQKLESDDAQTGEKQRMEEQREEEQIVKKINSEDLFSLLKAINSSGLEVIKTENLYSFSGIKGYSSIGG